MQRAPLIALLTDFGLADPYVGQMKAVLACAAPLATLLDVSHGVAMGDVAQASFFLAATLPWLPPGSVAAAVVDPGVGTARRIIAAELDGRFVLAPDNGLLTLPLARAEAVRAFDATPHLAPASATFHGRDVFAPLAARLAAGDAIEQLGPLLPREALVALLGLSARRQGEAVTTRVLSVDIFGNVVTSCDVERFGGFRQARLIAPVGRELVRAATYGELSPGAVGFLAGSQGYLELAVRDGSAAAALGLSRGDFLEFWLPEGGA